MKVTDFKFGSIRINGKEYKEDVFVLGNSVEIKESGHTIRKKEVEKLVLEEPKQIIIGTGTTGKVKITEEALSFVKSNNIDIILEKTPKAVEIFNKNNNAVGLFHLTC